MSKNILFFLLIIGSIVGSTLLFREPVQSKPVVSVTPPSVSAQTSASATSQEKDGISVTVKDIKQTNETTVVALVLDNHSVNLGEDRVYEEATLGGATSLSHVFLSNAAGGHHVEVEVVFPKTTSGNLVIIPAENTSFTFSDLW